MFKKRKRSSNNSDRIVKAEKKPLNHHLIEWRIQSFNMQNWNRPPIMELMKNRAIEVRRRKLNDF